MLRGLIKITALIITGIIVLLYSGSMAAIIVPPHKAIVPSFLGMGMPLLWGLAVAALIFWLLNKKWLISLFLTGVITLSFPIWRNTIVMHSKVKNTNGNTIKVLTYNIHLFNSYKSYEEILTMIEGESPDIVCLQEFGYYNRKGKDRITQEELLKRIDKMYPYRHLWYKNQKGTSSNGLITLSRYPIIKKQKIMYSSDFNISIYSDIDIDGDTIRVINNHLESNRLNTSQRQWAKHLLEDDFEKDEFINSTKSVSTTLREAIIKRAEQAEVVGVEVSNSPYKIIVCGDFNDVCQSYTYHQIKQDLQDAYAQAGPWGYYWTYNENMLLLPIDHILVSKELTTIEAKILKRSYSDHYAMTATMAIE